MKPVVCPYEEAVRRAATLAATPAATLTATLKKLDPELAAHVDACAPCRETLQVAGWLRRAAAADRPPRLPAPGQLWWKAQIARRLAAPDPRLERAARPALWGLGLGGLTMLVALLVAVTLGLSRLEKAFSGFPVELPPAWLAVAFAAVVTPAAALAVLVFMVWREA